MADARDQTASLAPPGIDVLQGRYAERRRLRTRALGTPFWVQAAPQGLQVTTGQGSVRIVTTEHLRACWPHLVADEPMSRWKKHSGDNSSYIGAIFDDLATVRSADTKPLDTMPREYLDTVLQAGLKDEQIADLQEEVNRLKERLLTAGGQEPSLRRTIEDLRRQLATVRTDVAERTAKAEALRTELAAAQARVLALGKLASGGQGGVAGQSTTRLEQELMRAETRANEATTKLEAVQRSEASVRERLEAAQFDVDRLTNDVRSVGRELEETRKEVRSLRTRTPITVSVDSAAAGVVIDGYVDEAVAGFLVSAGRQVRSQPMTAVECRQALETYVLLLWGRANGHRVAGDRRPFHLLMQDLRDHPTMPPGDWHAAKNMWSRSSAIVHGEAPASPYVALWLWLGIVDLVRTASRAD